MATKLSAVNFGIAQRAVESLGSTVEDLAERQEWELEDAIDAHNPKLSSAERFRLLAGVREQVAQAGGRFAEGARFSSYEELSQWVIAAAEQKGYSTRETTERGRTTLYVDTPVGELNFEFREAIDYGVSAEDPDRANAAVHDLLRAARALQDES